MNISLQRNRCLLVLCLASLLGNVRRAESQQTVTGPHTFAPVVEAPTLLIQSPEEWLGGQRTSEPDEANAAPVLWVSVIEQGRIAFEESCTQCHEAEQALEHSKSFDEWLVVIQEMSEKEDADIDADNFHRIAAYLASRSAAEIQTAADARAESESDPSESDPSESDMASVNGSGDTTTPSPALVAAGEAAFYRSCVKCHDAERSLSKRKGLSAWRATVRRMAAKDGADVRSSDVEAIATFLASQGGGGDITGAADEVNPWAFSTTLSTLHRASSDSIENPGFFVDAWMGADWQSDGPLRATVMVCTSCHSDRNTSKGFTLELVEASATVDLKMIFSDHHAEMSRSTDFHSLNGDGHDGISVAGSAYDCPISTSADLKMGRFVVPFGAFSSVSHPGSYRTVSNPLMYNMGRRINTGGPFQPVLPAPYSDEGVNLHFALREYCDRSYTLDFFAVNGLQGNASGVNFNLSRSYTDNNRSPAIGGRVTLGNQRFRLGASGMTGRMQNAGSAPLDYQLVGADASIHAKKLRAFFEYAIRVDDLGPPQRNETNGYIIELEYKLREKLGLLARYDTLEHRLVNDGELTTERFTWGLNFTLNRAGLLLLNHEHWMLNDRSDVDVVGLRWVATF